MRWRVAMVLVLPALVAGAPSSEAQSFSSGSTGADGALLLTVPESRTYGGYGHTATVLLDGKVLVTGGYNGGYRNLAELYDPATGRFAALAGMNAARYAHTATLLRNGKVLLAGGYNGGVYLNTAELYDPATQTFVNVTAPMFSRRGWHAAVLLADGRVLLAGGIQGSSDVDAAELYDPAAGPTGGFTATGVMSSRRQCVGALLLDGKVLVVAQTGNNSGDVYDPATGTFAPIGNGLSVSRSTFTVTRLPSGKVLVAGGNNGGARAEADLYDPSTNRFTPTAGALNSARHGHTATLLANGKVLIAGGYLNAAELYDPVLGRFVPTSGSAAHHRGYGTASQLQDGSVLLVGGDHSGFNSGFSTAERYDSDSDAFNTFTFRVDALPPRPDGQKVDPEGDNVFHFTSIVVPSRLRVRLSSKHLNGPVYWLARDEVRIDGAIDLNGGAGHPTTSHAAERLPSDAGAGGFAGGIGGNTTASPAQAGSGPMGGAPKNGGRFSGNALLVPLIGGSGGGGYDRPASENRWGAGGGAGGGAILIASSASIVVNGTISAEGGNGRDGDCGSGSGAGGAIRLVAPTIAGSAGARLLVGPGTNNACGTSQPPIIEPMGGHVRLEAHLQSFSGTSSGTLTKASPLATFVPTGKAALIRVVRIGGVNGVGGVDVPANPTGSFELPDVTINRSQPTTVEIEATQIPVGTEVSLHLSSVESADLHVTTKCPGSTPTTPCCSALDEDFKSTCTSILFPPGFTRGFARAVW
jgi:hypothetical protein